MRKVMKKAKTVKGIDRNDWNNRNNRIDRLEVLRWLVNAGILACLLVAGMAAAKAQPGSSVVVQSLFNSTVGTCNPVACNSSPVNNLGQSQHQAVVTLNYVSGPFPCSPADAVVATFQASLNNVTWFDIGSPLSGISQDRQGSQIGIVQADGVYPYVRFQIGNQPTSPGCTISVQYQGSLYPNASASALLSKATSAGFQNRASRVVVPGGGYVEAVFTPPTGRSVVLYQAIVNLEATPPLGAAATLIIACVASGPTYNPIASSYIPSGATTYSALVLPGSGLPYRTCLPDDTLRVGLTGPPGAFLNYSLGFRFEDRP